MSDMDEHESMRREILAILALGRKGTRRGAVVSGSRSAAGGNGDSQAKTTATATPAAMTTTTTTVTVSRPAASTTTASTAHRLSPLAVEAQEHIPEQVEDDDDDEVLKMTATGTKAMRMEEGAEMMDPCEHIAFMLVPKSRYEFQPLIV